MQAYGAGKAGEAFDPLVFFQQPGTIVRLISWLFSIVVFACVSNEGYIKGKDEDDWFCIFNKNANACRYGVTMGTLAFLSCAVLLALDAFFPQISSVKDRKKAVLADIGASAAWVFLWFVGFCFLASQWGASERSDNPRGEGGDAARAAIVFSFFSIFTWSAQAFLGFQKYKMGADSNLFDPQEYVDPNAGQTGAAPEEYQYSGDTEAPPTTEPNYDGSEPGYQGQEYTQDYTQE